MKERSSSGLLFFIPGTVFDFWKGRLEALATAFFFSTVNKQPATLGSDLYGGFNALIKLQIGAFHQPDAVLLHQI